MFEPKGKCWYLGFVKKIFIILFSLFPLATTCTQTQNIQITATDETVAVVAALQSTMASMQLFYYVDFVTCYMSENPSYGAAQSCTGDYNFGYMIDEETDNNQGATATLASDNCQYTCNEASYTLQDARYNLTFNSFSFSVLYGGSTHTVTPKEGDELYFMSSGTIAVSDENITPDTTNTISGNMTITLSDDSVASVVFSDMSVVMTTDDYFYWTSNSFSLQLTYNGTSYTCAGNAVYTSYGNAPVSFQVDSLLCTENI